MVEFDRLPFEDPNVPDSRIVVLDLFCVARVTPWGDPWTRYQDSGVCERLEEAPRQLPRSDIWRITVTEGILEQYIYIYIFATQPD